MIHNIIFVITPIIVAVVFIYISLTTLQGNYNVNWCSSLQEIVSVVSSTRIGLYAEAFNVSDIKKYGRSSTRVGMFQRTIFTLINGTLSDIKAIPRDEVMNVLWAIERVVLNKGTQVALWDIIKDGIPLKSLKKDFLQRLGKLVLAIPQPELFQLNMSDWTLVTYLGTVRGFSRRQLGVLAYALLTAQGQNLLQDLQAINRMVGILCGFPPLHLEKIPPDIFVAINSSVFLHLDGCTETQLKVLLSIAVKSVAFGPPASWSINDTAHLGMLITALSDDDLRTMRLNSIAGIDPHVISSLRPYQLYLFRMEQVKKMNEGSLATFRRRTGLISSAIVNTLHRIYVAPTVLCVAWIN